MTDVDASRGTLQVTCPECGAVAHVQAGARLASDFCPQCDYPLFWARPSAAPASRSRRSCSRTAMPIIAVRPACSGSPASATTAS